MKLYIVTKYYLKLLLVTLLLSLKYQILFSLPMNLGFAKNKNMLEQENTSCNKGNNTNNNHVVSSDDEVIHSETKTTVDNDGIVKVTLQWLKRPGEMAIEINYFGYLIQEGTVNFYLSVNGVQREFMTLLHKEPLSFHKTRILSFHPTIIENGITKIKELANGEIVDKELFKNAAYYSHFGKTFIEVKFFAHGRWDGDGNNGNSNYVFEFESPIKE